MGSVDDFEDPLYCHEQFIVDSQPCCHEQFIVDSQPCCHEQFIVDSQPCCHEQLIVDSQPWTASAFFKLFPVPVEMEPLLRHLYGEAVSRTREQEPEKEPVPANLSRPSEIKEENDDDKEEEEVYAMCARRRSFRRRKKLPIKRTSNRSALKSALAQHKPRSGGAFVPAWFPFDCPFRYRKGYTREYVVHLMRTNTVPARKLTRRLARRLARFW